MLPQRKGPSGPKNNDFTGVEAWDTVRENFQFPATDIATAAELPSLPRDSIGTPLGVDLGTWVPGDYLHVRWAGSASGILSPGASGLLVPKVQVGGDDFKFIDNGAQIGLVGIPGALVYAFGDCIVRLDTNDEVRVELGIALIEGAPGDRLDLFGGPLSFVTPVFASTWLMARRIAASQIISIPPVALSPLPIPS